MKRLLKLTLINTLPIMAGYLVLGFGFGVLLEESGHGFSWAFLMSTIIYGGSMQYVAVDLISSGASFITTALTSVMVNARHIFYGISMIEKYKGMGIVKPYMIFAMTDETYSMVCRGKFPDGVNPKKYCFLVSLFNHIYWIIGGLLGVLGGTLMKFSSEGIDFVMTALFVTIFIEQWQSTKEHIPALIGVGATALCLIIFGSESFLIPAMILISALFLLGRPVIEKKEAELNG